MKEAARLIVEHPKEKTTDTKIAKPTASNPYRISRPVAGFVCLEPELHPLMETDKSTLGPLFFEVRSSSGGNVPCDVLFLYCKVDKDGSLPGSNMRIRDFVKASGSRVAIVASENDHKHYMHALQPKTIGQRILCLLLIGVARFSPCSFRNCLRR